MDFKNGVVNIQTAVYNGGPMVQTTFLPPKLIFHLTDKKISCISFFSPLTNFKKNSQQFVINDLKYNRKNLYVQSICTIYTTLNLQKEYLGGQNSG